MRGLPKTFDTTMLIGINVFISVFPWKFGKNNKIKGKTKRGGKNKDNSPAASFHHMIISSRHKNKNFFPSKIFFKPRQQKNTGHDECVNRHQYFLRSSRKKKAIRTFSSCSLCETLKRRLSPLCFKIHVANETT